MTRISTGTVSIDNGDTIFTLWDGDADVTLSEITSPAGSQVVIEGVANFIKTRLSSSSAELVLPHAGPGGAGLACAISAMTPAETQVGTLNARVAGVIQGLAVVQANGLGLGYRFSTATADADPGPGYVRLNAEPALATMMYIDDVSGSGFEVGELVSRWGIGSSLIKGTVQLSSAANDGAFAGFEVTGPVIDGGSYRKVPIAVVGDPSAWSDEAELMVAFAATGNAGEGFITDATVADTSELAPLESEDPGYLVFVTDLGTDFGAYSGRSGVVRLIAGPDWEVTAVYTGATGPASTVPGPTGPAGLVWVSTVWDAGTTYALNEAVQKDGSSWRSLQDGNLNHSPPTLPTISNAWWALVARRGNDGAGTVAGVTAGTGMAVNNTDATNPVVSVVAFTGDSGAGGALGGVPAPAAGDAAAKKVLGAGGGWVSPFEPGTILMRFTTLLPGFIAWGEGGTFDRATNPALAAWLDANGADLGLNPTQIAAGTIPDWRDYVPRTAGGLLGPAVGQKQEDALQTFIAQYGARGSGDGSPLTAGGSADYRVPWANNAGGTGTQVFFSIRTAIDGPSPRMATETRVKSFGVRWQIKT